MIDTLDRTSADSLVSPASQPHPEDLESQTIIPVTPVPTVQRPSELHEDTNGGLMEEVATEVAIPGKQGESSSRHGEVLGHEAVDHLENIENGTGQQQVNMEPDHDKITTTPSGRPGSHLTATIAVIDEEPRANEDMVYSRPTSIDLEENTPERDSRHQRPKAKVKCYNCCFPFRVCNDEIEVKNWFDCAFWSCCCLISVPTCGLPIMCILACGS